MKFGFAVMYDKPLQDGSFSEYSGQLASVHLTRPSAEAEVARMNAAAIRGKYEHRYFLKEDVPLYS